jgi:hypothetical protein
MAFLFTLFTVALSVCVVGLIVLALSSILGSVRDDWKSKKLKREPLRESTAAVPRQFRVMTKVEVSGPEVLERWKTEAAANCAPLYIQDAFLFDGHDASTKNATATFVKFKDSYYACTCRHAVEIVRKRRETGRSPFPTLALGLRSGFINLSFISTDGLRDAISIVKPGESESYLDLAIADVSQHWATLSKEWGNRAIEIDRENWHEPRWGPCQAVGSCRMAGNGEEKCDRKREAPGSRLNHSYHCGCERRDIPTRRYHTDEQ